MWSKTNGNNCMIMRIKIHKTWTNHENKIKRERTLLVLQRAEGKPDK